MLFEGVFTWFMLTLGRRADGGAARPRHRRARLHPQYRRDHVRRADGRGRVQRRAAPGRSGRSSSISSSRTSTAIWSCPFIARRTVDLAPALMFAMQLLMGALFGILGSVRRSDPRDPQSRADRPQPARRGRDTRGSREAPPRLNLLLGAVRSCIIAAALGTIWTTRTSYSRSALGGIGAARGRVGAIGQPLGYGT